MDREQQEYLNEIFLGKEDPDMAFKKPMTNNLKDEIEKILHLVWCGALDIYTSKDFRSEDVALSEETYLKAQKSVREHYAQEILTLINQKEKEVLDKVERLLNDRFVGCAGYTPNVDESGNQLYGCLYCGEARSSAVHTVAEVKLGVKQLKEELKGGDKSL